MSWPACGVLQWSNAQRAIAAGLLGRYQIPMGELVDRGAPGLAAAARPRPSIETRASWAAATIVLGILAISYGSMLIAVVGLKPITEDLGTPRQLVALASALTWLGTGAGGILVGGVAERL